MVNKEVVLETIKKMFDSGIEDSVVKQTLKDIGLNESEIAQYIAEVKGEAPVQKPKKEKAPGPNELKREINEKHEKEEAMHTTTHSALEGQDEKLSNVGQQLKVCETKLASIQSQGGKGIENAIAPLNKRIAGLEAQVSDLKALNKALKTIMEKILETDRKILDKL